MVLEIQVQDWAAPLDSVSGGVKASHDKKMCMYLSVSPYKAAVIQ